MWFPNVWIACTCTCDMYMLHVLCMCECACACVCARCRAAVCLRKMDVTQEKRLFPLARNVVDWQWLCGRGSQQHPGRHRAWEQGRCVPVWVVRCVCESRPSGDSAQPQVGVVADFLRPPVVDFLPSLSSVFAPRARRPRTGPVALHRVGCSASDRSDVPLPLQFKRICPTLACTTPSAPQGACPALVSRLITRGQGARML